MNLRYDVTSPDYAWLNLAKKDIRGLKNPLIKLDPTHKDFHLEVIKLLKDPKYFQWTVKHLLGVDLLPMQTVILQELWVRSFPMYIASRGQGKSFLLAIYSLLRLLLIPESKIVIVGAAFRQSKVIFEYMDTLWKNAPLYRSVCSESSGPRRDIDRCTFKINNSVAYAIPIGDGTKIRGLRAHTILADEFNSIPVEIYETVIVGFASVSKDPPKNVKKAAKRRKLQKMGKWSEDDEDEYKSRRQNQSILSGTAGYDFEPFADYWRKYKAMIRECVKKEEEEVGVPDYMKKLDKSQFAIVRIPYELVPEGFMDDQQVSRARATMHTGTYLQEYGASFPKDSKGFFKRTLLESCVCHKKNMDTVGWPTWCPAPFQAAVRGHSGKQYVYGIDPASEVDNFAIVIEELHPEHQRVVYVWTTNKKDFAVRKKLGLTAVDDYYSFCVRKIRDLMQVFPCACIGIDSQGGGYQIAEGLQDTDKINKDFNEVPILEIIEEKHPKPTDDIAGQHILQFVNFASAEWTSNANHGLRKDMEDRFVLFPEFDRLTLALMSEQDKVRFNKLKKIIGDTPDLKLYDTLEDCVLDIEELKNELSTIIVTRTPSGREHFDTPEIKLGTGKKGRMRKDRYSAFVICNMIARSMQRELPATEYQVIGKVAGDDGDKSDDQVMYKGQNWMTSFKPVVIGNGVVNNRY